MSSAELLLLRANDVCFLGSARACAAAGVPTHAVTYTWQGAGAWYSEHSRVVPAPRVIPNPFSDPAGALQALVEVAADLDRPLAIPSSDTNLMFLLDHADTLAPHVRMMGGHDLEAGRLDVIGKHTCATLLREGGVAIPQTFACSRAEHIDAIAERIAFPCIYKPATKDYGQTFYATHGGSKAIEVADADTLRRRLQAEMDAGYALVVQERVFFDGPRDEIPCYVYVDANHKVRMAATAIKHTISPHPFGTATVLYLTWHPELLALAEAVATALRWRGILMIEFIRDQRDGVWKVIEVNGRPWLFVDFFRRFGLNYLQYMHEDLRGDTRGWPPLRTPADATLRAQPVHISLPAAVAPSLDALPRPPREEDVVAYLQSLPGRRTLTFLDPADPGPGEAELRDLARRYRLKEDRLLGMVQNALSGD